MRYVIGIDLGTTNSCVSYVDTYNPKLSVQLLRIPQLVQAGYVENLETLPSFCYLAADQEWPSGSLNLPWQKESKFFVGSMARIQGAKVPTRLVQSAKSWLCHSAVNRREKMLPFESVSEAQRISPLEATTRYLRHIKGAWNHLMVKGDPESEFEAQDIVLTVPASFDEVARMLTVEAAKMAGFIKMTLLEEPQAAFYSWISQHENSWEKYLKANDCILVCDVGGGTTDFSLIDVSEKEGKLAFTRMAVGDHLLLGGDNMDSAIAHVLEGKLKEKGFPECTSLQWQQLKHEGRKAKESLLSGDEEIYRVLIQGSGSSVIQGSMMTEISRTEIHKFLCEGFFGLYSWQEALDLKKSSGFRSMGLPYEEDPSITKHLASFLKKASIQNPKVPDYVLFNGGAMKPLLFQEAVLQSLMKWFPEKKPQTLPSISLDLAVSRGAAYYGKARRGLGVKIGGGSSRGYYLALDIQNESGDVSQKALTLLPRGFEEGSIYEPDQNFFLKPNTPVAFHLYSSHTRLDDKQGDLVEIDLQAMHPLPPIHTILKFGKKQFKEDQQQKMPVHLHLQSTAIGTLQLSLKSVKTTHEWALEFQLRQSSGQENQIAALEKARVDETYEITHLQLAQNAVSSLFSKTSSSGKPHHLSIMENLEGILELPRRDWSPSILRGLWEPLWKEASHRKNSSEHELRWWNLAGFLLRPGYGYPLDDFRMKEFWKIILGEQKSVKSSDCLIQMWICYRRIAGGLNKGQQMQLASEITAQLYNKKSGKIETKNKGEQYHYSEKIRTLASFEFLEISQKVKLAEAIINRINKKEAIQADYWALARIGSRHLIYGSSTNVIPKEICEKWIDALLKIKEVDTQQLLFIIGQLARKTDHRDINISQRMINQILSYFKGLAGYESLENLLLHESHLTIQEQELLLGDRLPAGLILEVK